MEGMKYVFVVRAHREVYSNEDVRITANCEPNTAGSERNYSNQILELPGDTFRPVTIVKSEIQPH